MNKPKDKNGKLLKYGQTVVVPDPSLPDDFWKHSFQGRVVAVKALFNSLVCVVDQDDNGWDVESERLEII